MELNNYQNVEALEANVDGANGTEALLQHPPGANRRPSLWLRVMNVTRSRRQLSSYCVTILTCSAFVLTIVTFLSVLQKMFGAGNDNDPNP